MYVWLINSLVVAAVVMVHYEFLYRFTLYIPKLKIKHRYRILFGVFSALIAHVIEIWLFALAYYFKHKAEGWGELTGNFDGSLMDCMYFSFTVFSTVGFGDIAPTGDLRYLTGIESLTGLVLITWTASFLFIEMQRDWDKPG
ncbi:potassium channel family protein [Arsukibacterium sp. MJ3]|uniref:potassium channel family protein n=1 Tax=Arsukibacterium sp. MJ3 TaxID=1632859 RepID=UPI001F244B69|nr:potassium channel family protein [Arsukibacterium sp. MJ3]